MQFLEEKPLKKRSRNEPKVEEPPSSIICSFISSEGNRAGPPIDLPSITSSKQLEQLINSLLSNTESLPYAFYINDIEVIDSVSDTLLKLAVDGKQQSYESTLTITFQPLSVFRVRPVTRCTETMPGHTEAILHVSYSPDGSRLASGGGDTTVRFWNPNTCMPSHTCTGHRNHVLCTAWSPDGNMFVSADKNGEIRVWDPKSGKQIGQAMNGHRKWVTFLCFEPLHLTGNNLPSRLASSSKDQTVRIWNVITGQCETVISGHLDSVECVKWGGTGLLYTASRDRTIKVWDVDGHGRSQQKLVRTLSGHGHRVNSLALSCDYVLRTGGFQLGEDAPSSVEMAKEKALARYNTVVGTEGEKLVSASDDFTLFMWSPTTGKAPIQRLTGHQQLVNHIAFSPDGRFFASASFDKKVKLWCGKTGTFINTFIGHVSAVYQLAWSADSNYIVSASKDSTLKLWSVKDAKKAIYTLPGHEDEVYALDWSPNGTQVASGSKDRTIKVWHH